MSRPPHIHTPSLVQRPSGLYVPSALIEAKAQTARLLELPEEQLPEKTLLVVGEPPSDLDAVFVAPDPEVLGVRNPTLSEIRRMLAVVPLEPALFAVSAIASAAWHARRDQARHLELAEEIFADRPLLGLLRRFIAEDRHHVIFNEQHLTILTRLLIECGAESAPGAEMSSSELDAFLMALVGVGGLSARHADPFETGAKPMGWVPWLLRSGLYFDRTNLGSEHGRARALFVELAGEADSNGPNWLDLGEWMADDLLPAADQLGFGFAMGALTKALLPDVPTVERFIAIVPEGLLGGNAAPNDVERLVLACSASREEFISAFDGFDDADHLLWDRTPFEQRPFFRLRDGRLVLLSPRFLESWMGEGFYYRLLDAAMRRRDPDRPKQKATLRFTRFHGELMERYVERVTERSHIDQARAGVVRINGERAYIGKRGTEQKTPDLLLNYATDLVAIEVTGGRPSRRTRILSDPSLIEKELATRVIGKLTELDAALVDVLDGTAVIPELRLDLIQRVWPVLIVPSTLIQSEFLWDYIDTKAPSLFSHHGALQAPTLFSIEDMERALSAVEEGAGLPQILQARISSVYRRMPPSHFFERHFNSSRRPAYLDEQVRLFHAEAAAALSLRDPGS